MLRRSLAWISTPAAVRFRQALKDPQRAQDHILSNLIQPMAHTEYGKSIGLTGTESYEEFASRVPIVNYDSLEPWIQRQGREKGRTLCPETILFYERTSGSSGPVKRIPYTPGLHSSFQRMFWLWLHDLMAHGPRHGMSYRGGRVFFSISPAMMEPETTEAGTPVGLEDDTGYLAGMTRTLFRKMSAVPPEVKGIRDPDSYKDAICRSLLSCGDLEVISVWDPSYLEILLERMGQRDWKKVWPRLQLISCWKSAHAAPGFARLQARFPGLLIQGKGLLATEAPITLPLLDAGGFVPLVSEVFLEFRDESTGRIRRLHELDLGSRYSVILSQRGGLLRYEMGDWIEVTGFSQSTPLLEFVGRESAVSSIVGEKLHETFVSRSLQKIPRLSESFWLLLPESSPQGGRYVLVTDWENAPTEELAIALDDKLRESYHYRYARLLGQLAAPRVIRQSAAREKFHALQMNRGMKWGNIKPRALLTDLELGRSYLSELVT